QGKRKSVRKELADNCCGYLQRVNDAPFIPFPTSRRRYRTPFQKLVCVPAGGSARKLSDCEENPATRNCGNCAASLGTVIAISRRRRMDEEAIRNHVNHSDSRIRDQKIEFGC